MAQSPEARRIAAAEIMTKMNTLFSVAAFIGLGMTENTQANNISTECRLVISVAKNLVKFHMFVFGSFSISGSIAFSTMSILSVCTSVVACSRALRFFMAISGMFHMLGSTFMLLAMTNLVQIKLGCIDCSSVTLITVLALLIGLPISTLISTTLCLYAFITE